MKSLVLAFFGLFLGFACLPGQEILDQPVPWSGTITRTTAKEMIARMTGWAEGSGKEGFTLATRIHARVADRRIDRLEVPDDPRPTFRELLSEVLGGRGVKIDRGRDGIEVTFLMQRSYTLRFGTVGKLKQAGKWSTEGLRKDLKSKGWKFSKHFEMTLIKQSQTLIVRGLLDDCRKMDRYLSR